MPGATALMQLNEPRSCVSKCVGEIRPRHVEQRLLRGRTRRVVHENLDARAEPRFGVGQPSATTASASVTSAANVSAWPPD